MLKQGKIKDTSVLFLFALPGMVYFIIFKYIPIAGNVIAFQHYNLFQGIMGSEWAGLEHFRRMIEFPDLSQVFWNSLRLGFFTLLFGFPAPILLALLLNEVRTMWLKRTVQTIVYMPHFLSWVIVGSIFLILLSHNGMVNQVRESFGFESILYVQSEQHFLGVLISTGIWKEVGWGTIIYLAALATIHPSLYEAAVVDGAGRWRQMWHISLPGLVPTMIVILLLSIGNILDANVEQVLFFLNPLVMDVGDVFDTYMYRVGLVGGQYSYTTAIGLFKAVIGLALVIGLNTLSRKTTGESIY